VNGNSPPQSWGAPYRRSSVSKSRLREMDPQKLHGRGRISRCKFSRTQALPTWERAAGNAYVRRGSARSAPICWTVAERRYSTKGNKDPQPKIWAHRNEKPQCTANIAVWGSAVGHLRAGLHSLARFSRFSVLEINAREHCPLFGIRDYWPEGT